LDVSKPILIIVIRTALLVALSHDHSLAHSMPSGAVHTNRA
jgi:hypothetical protein